MNANPKIWTRLFAVVLSLALGLSVVPAAQAQTPSAKAKPALSKSQPATAAKPSGGQQEGIKVHGEWTIVVRNPDGKEVDRREFKNRIWPSGMQMLVQAMDRSSSFGRWKIVLWSPDTNFNLCGTPPVRRPCGIMESGAFDQVAGFGVIDFQMGLLKAPDFSDPLSPKFVLSNTPGLRATFSGNITRVTTVVEICSPVSAPIAPCQTSQDSASWVFTQAEAGITPGFGVPVPVQAGQLIDVTVKLSFS